MSIQDLGSLGEFVAAIATIATLIYLAMQIRQNTESVRMQAEISVSQQLADWAAEVVANPDVARIWDAAAEDPESLEPNDRAVFIWFMAQLFLIYEGQYHLYKKGHITENAWKPKLHSLLGLLQNPIVIPWWESRAAPFSPEFVDYLDAMRDSPDIEWSHQSISRASNPSAN